MSRATTRDKERSATISHRHGIHIGFYNLPFLEVSGGWRMKTVGIRGVLTPRVCLVPATISYKRE